MSKKDYQAIARELHAISQDVRVWQLATELVMSEVVNRLANLLSANPRFDRARFLEACETGKCKGMKG